MIMNWQSGGQRGDESVASTSAGLQEVAVSIFLVSAVVVPYNTASRTLGLPKRKPHRPPISNLKSQIRIRDELLVPLYIAAV